MHLDDARNGLVFGRLEVILSGLALVEELTLVEELFWTLQRADVVCAERRKEFGLRTGHGVMGDEKGWV